MGSGRSAGLPAEVEPPKREHPNIPVKGEPYQALIIEFVSHEFKDKHIWRAWVAEPDEEAQLWVAYNPDVYPRDIIDFLVDRWYGKPSVVMEVTI